MTIKDFLEAVEGYYGPYRPVQKRIVAQYLAQRAWPPEYLSSLFAYLTKTVSCEKHFVPDIAVFVRLSARELPTPDRPVKALPEPEVTEDRRTEVRNMAEKILGRKLNVQW